MNPDIAEQIIATLHTRIDELIVERDALKAAGKLAIESMLDVIHGGRVFGEPVKQAITALRQAGVR